MKKEKSKVGQRIFLTAVFLTGFVIIFILSRMDHDFGSLPYYNPEKIIQKNVDGVTVSDTVWSTIPEFQLVDEYGESIDRSHIDDHVTVVDFFFTTCTTICPKMTRQMRTLVWELDEPYFEEIRFLSFTVDPEYDTPEVLRNYKKDMEIDDPRWSFATGDKEIIYDLGVNSFRVTTQEDVNELGNFLHSEKFILLDKEGYIRGYYDGTDSDDVRRLDEDIKILIGSERKQKKREGR
ncbi:MAG: SCO family protein [Flavobacteriales bacterium]|nr:SCO family protein [Flavobacteriales bacterium]